jgi:hypothetical protein
MAVPSAACSALKLAAVKVAWWVVTMVAASAEMKAEHSVACLAERMAASSAGLSAAPRAVLMVVMLAARLAASLGLKMAV